MASNISASEVKKLREQTGAGMMDAKAALEEAGGDLAAATEILRRKGVLKASKKAERITNQGVIESYIHGEGRIGVLVEINSETDFVARNADFRALAHDIALHIAASAPLYVSRNEVPGEAVAKEKEIYMQQALTEGKGADIVDRIVQGKIEKYYQETCLLEQPFVRDQEITVADLINQKVATIGENIQVRRFTRYVLGE